MRRRVLAACLLLGAPFIAWAVELEFRLVPYDRPDVTVESLARERPILNPVQTERGVEMQKVGLDVVCWSRNVLLDGEPIFERYHEGKYVDRLPRARRDLKPGRHVLWPGDHAFTVKDDNTVAVESPDLSVDGTVVRLKAYPVTVRAYQANPDDGDLPPVMRVAPLPQLTVRESGDVSTQELARAAARSEGKRAPPIKARELLPVFDKFAPLTIWLPGHRAGQGYLLHPLGLSFHLGPDGIVSGAGGGAAAVPGVRIAGWEIEVPLYSHPVAGEAGCSLVASGLDRVSWSDRDAGADKPLLLYPRREPYELRIANAGPALEIAGDLSRLPVKSVRVDRPDLVAGVQRAVLLELPGRHFKPGEVVRAQLQGIDPAVPPAAKVDADDEAAAAGTNRLADAVPYARLQPYGEERWIDVPVSSVSVREVSAALPAVPDGVYRLEVGLRPRDAALPPIGAAAWVSVAAPRDWSVGLFTVRGRTAFFRGETIRVAAGAVAAGKPIPAGTRLQVELVDPAGRRFPLAKESLAAAVRERETWLYAIDAEQSLRLAPGRYTVEAALGETRARPLAVEIVDPEPRTHFGNILMGKYSGQGKRYEDAILSGRGAEELASEIAGLGCNGFKGMAYSQDRVVRPDVGVEQVVRERPELGPWESYYQPSGRDRFLDAAVRNNLRFWENLFTYNDTSLPRGDKIVAGCARYAGLETHALRHSPAFQGVCLYDEIYNRSLNDGVPVCTAFEQAMELGYRAKYPDLTSARAMKALDRYAGRPLDQRSVADLELFRTYPAYEDECWSLWTHALAASVRGVMPASRNFALYRYWGGNGGNISVLGKEEEVFEPLEIAACVMYKDGGYGDRPVFAPMQADVLRALPGREVWTQLHDFNGPGQYGQHLLRQAFFALSQRPDGFTYFCMSNDRDAMQNIAGTLGTRYGDFFLSLEKGYKGVAIYYSRTAQYLAPRKPNSLGHQCEGLWVACLRAGFPADFLRDPDIRAGRGMEYEAIFVPGFTYEDECPPDVLAALRRLVNAGKTVFVERSSRLPVEGVVRLDSELNEYDAGAGHFPKYVDFETETVWEQSVETTALVREALAKRIQPAARHSLTVGPDWLRSGDGQYMVLPNLNPAPFAGLYKTLYQAPDRPRLEFPKRPPVCYDLLEMKLEAVQTNGDWMVVEPDLRHYPGKILAFLPARIGSVRLEATPALEAGGTLSYRVAVLDEAGQPLRASFPLEVRLADGAGREAQLVYRAAAPEFLGAYVVPVNGAPGAWKLVVRELVSGRAAEASIEVRAAGTVTAAREAQPVRVSDPGRVAGFVAAKGPEILVPLDDGQDWARPAAERLVAALGQRGLTARIVKAAEAAQPPGPWDAVQPVLDGTRMWRGNVIQPGFFIESPVILLGRRGENRLIEALIRRDALSEPLSTAFPGPGRALVAWTRRAFSNGHDALTVLANDAEGLTAGVDALLATAAKIPPEGGTTNAAGLLRPQYVVPAPSAGLALGRAAAPVVESFADLANGEDMVRALDRDPATGRVLAGTFGYGENLFCLGPDGALLWKVYLPEQDVYFARWYDDGKRVVAATGRGWFVFLLDGATGKVLRKFASTEWPDTHYDEGAEETHVRIAVNAALRQILVGGRSGLLAVDFDGKRQWLNDRVERIVAFPKEAEKSGGAPAFPVSAKVGDFALSPDGSRIAYGEYRLVGSTEINKQIVDVWAYQPKVMDARTGAVLCENLDDPGNQTSAGGWSLRWPAGSEVPWMDTGSITIPLLADGKRGPAETIRGDRLPGGDWLRRTEADVERLDPAGVARWRLGHADRMDQGLDWIDGAQGRLYRCTWQGTVVCVDLGQGRELWRRPLGFRARLQPSGEQLVAGTIQGGVTLLGTNGVPVWQASLRGLHEPPTGDYGAYVAAGLQRDPDSTGDFFPAGEDKPGDYDKVLRLGLEQLVDGAFETGKSWAKAAGPLGRSDAGRSGKALKLAPGELVSQTLDRRVIPLGTYLLEFFYRPASPAAKLVAGARLADERDTFTLSTFGGRPGEWQFARVAVKALAGTQRLEIGFEAVGGEVEVDDASLRPVRFPSANLLAQPELHAVEPTFVRDTRVQYNRIPSALRQKLMGRNRVSAYKQGGTETATQYREEEGFLQNGRLDDVGPVWIYQPDGIGFSAVLTKPAWISHVVLYLNNARPDDAYRTLAILANNLEEKIPQVVHVVRNNRRRFVVVHFEKPIQTDALQFLPGKQLRAHRDGLTEIELYGPVGGPDMGKAKGFPEDPLGWPMLMASPAHVPTNWPADLVGAFKEESRTSLGTPSFGVGAIAADGWFVTASPGGWLRSVPVGPEAPGRARRPSGPAWNIGTLPPLCTPAWYAGRLLVGGASEKLHAVAENGTPLWAFVTGGRVYAAPTPAGDDVFFGSDDGRIYKVDADSGILLWEYATGGKVRSAPALADGRVFAASWDGSLYALAAESGRRVWEAPLARYSRGAPAVHNGTVYIGDEEGHMRAYRAADGAPVFDVALGGRISACPAVSAAGVFFASEQGHAALVAPDGTVRWKRELGAEVPGQPIATQTQVLVPTSAGLMALRQADGQPDDRAKFPAQPGRLLAVLPYGPRACLVTGDAGTQYGGGPVTYAGYGGDAIIWAPESAEVKK